jgi:hypothetical protein
METVNLSFRYADEDYVRAMRAHYASRLRLPLDIAVTSGVAVFGAYEAVRVLCIWNHSATRFGHLRADSCCCDCRHSENLVSQPAKVPR